MFFLAELPSLDMVRRITAQHGGIDPHRVLEALTMLRRASILLRELEAFFVAHGLSQTRFLILMVVARELERDGLQPREIADRLDIARSNVTVALKALVEAGLLQRKKSTMDRRAVEMRLTAKGRTTLDTLLPAYFAIIDRHMASAP